MSGIAILDNGGQFTHLIATVIRNKVHVRADIYEPEVDVEKLKDYQGIIFSGGPSSLTDQDRPPFNKTIMDMEIPILGLCYGHYLIADHYGGKVVPSQRSEYGYADLNIDPDSDLSGLFFGLEQQQQVWMSHGDSVVEMPEGFVVIGSTETCPLAAMANADKKRYGFQFHPEVANTPKGAAMLENFVVRICKCQQDWTIENYIEWKVQQLKEEIGDKKVLILVSGGVDSTVCAALLANAIPPDNLYAIHIDNGLMRKDESKWVVQSLNEIGVMNAKLVNATYDFLGALEDKVLPEEKRKIIGNTFIDVSNREAESLALENWLLAQGTIYPDTIESGGTKHADVIKTHHNRVPIITEMIEQGKIVEPIADLYKAEVRELGEKLGLPKELVSRHPFPGPGLGVRVLCSDGKADDVSQIQAEVRLRNLKDQGMTGYVLPIKSVGVKGDSRSYEHPLLIVADENTPASQVKRVGIGLCNSIRGLNRVVLLLSPEKVDSWEVIPATLTKGRLDKTREADHIVMEALRKHGLYDEIWQCPTVLLPLKIGDGEVIIVRPIYSERAMTAEAAIPKKEFIDDITLNIMKIDGIGAVGLDLTNKPPGTIEWE